MNNKRMTLLRKELREYEAKTVMTDEERADLHEWVEAGHSVHDNGSMASYEGGHPLDFLDVYREEMEISEKLDSLDGKEREKYIRELRGEKNEEDLREENDHYWFLISIYEHVLRRYGLMDEAKHMITEAKRQSAEFLEACQLANEGLEMPFD